MNYDTMSRGDLMIRIRQLEGSDARSVYEQMLRLIDASGNPNMLLHFNRAWIEARLAELDGAKRV